MKYNDQTPDYLLKEYVKRCDERWEQLNSLLLSVITDGVKYLFVVNAGGCIAMLTFLGTSEDLRKQEWTWSVLFILFLGIVFVGFLNFARYHVIDYLQKKWNLDVVEFYEGKTDYDELSNKDDLRVNKTHWVLLFAYCAFICFLSAGYLGYIGVSKYKESLSYPKNGGRMNIKDEQKGHVPRPAPVAPPVQPPK